MQRTEPDEKDVVLRVRITRYKDGFIQLHVDDVNDAERMFDLVEDAARFAKRNRKKIVDAMHVVVERKEGSVDVDAK